MAGVDGLGRRVIGANPSAPARAMAADLDRLGVQVRPENVLQVRNALLGEAVRLAEGLRRYGRELKVGLCGTDPVSEPAQRGFNRKIDALKEDLQRYIDGLRDASDVLKETARSYGRTEAEIEGSFKAYADAKLPGWQQTMSERAALRSLPPALRAAPGMEPTAEAPPSLPDLFGRRP